MVVASIRAAEDWLWPAADELMIVIAGAGGDYDNLGKIFVALESASGFAAVNSNRFLAPDEMARPARRHRESSDVSGALNITA